MSNGSRFAKTANHLKAAFSVHIAAVLCSLERGLQKAAAPIRQGTGGELNVKSEKGIEYYGGNG
jgi:hypothetical protein